MNTSRIHIAISKFIMIFLFFCMFTVGIRCFSRVVLVGILGIENDFVNYLAYYSWGSYLLDNEYQSGEKIDEENEEYRVLKEIYLKVEAQKEKIGGIERETDILLKELTFSPKLERIDELKGEIESFCNEKFIFYQPFKRLKLNYNKLIGWDCAYAREEGAIYTLESGIEYNAEELQDITEEAKQIVTQKSIAEKLGADFLYVQIPFRISEDVEEVPWGVNAYQNVNASNKIEYLQSAGVDVADLRYLMTNAGWDSNSGYYQTDGHWNMKSGFIAAGCIAEYMNDYYFWNYDMDYFDINNFNVKVYSVNNPDVEETVEILLPKFETEIKTINVEKELMSEGDFENSCFDMSFVDTKRYSTVSTAYYTSRLRNSSFFEYVNNKDVNNDKRIMIYSHSMSWYLIPYLALDTAYVDFIHISECEKMENYIRELKPNMVIVLDW